MKLGNLLFCECPRNCLILILIILKSKWLSTFYWFDFKCIFGSALSQTENTNVLLTMSGPRGVSFTVHASKWFSLCDLHFSILFHIYLRLSIVVQKVIIVSWNYFWNTESNFAIRDYRFAPKILFLRFFHIF